MAMIVDGLSWALMLGGGFFVLVGGIGVLRLPDLYTRSHAAGITDTLGAGLMLAGMMLQGGFTLVTVKLVFIGLFLFFTNPTSSHALIHTAYSTGVEPLLDHDERGDERSEPADKEDAP